MIKEAVNSCKDIEEKIYLISNILENQAYLLTILLNELPEEKRKALQEKIIDDLKKGRNN
jgi:hypothetical protein